MTVNLFPTRMYNLFLQIAITQEYYCIIWIHVCHRYNLANDVFQLELDFLIVKYIYRSVVTAVQMN